MWILLVLMVNITGDYRSTSQSQIAVEFNNKESCVAAAEEWKKRINRDSRSVHVLCTPKGEKK